jgi:hypothetical protein
MYSAVGTEAVICHRCIITALQGPLRRMDPLAKHSLFNALEGSMSISIQRYEYLGQIWQLHNSSTPKAPYEMMPLT